jgi:hypothetical protein
MNEIQLNVITNISLLLPSLSTASLFARISDAQSWDTILHFLATSLTECTFPHQPATNPTRKEYRGQIYTCLTDLKREGGIPAFVMFRKPDIEDARGSRYLN